MLPPSSEDCFPAFHVFCPWFGNPLTRRLQPSPEAAAPASRRLPVVGGKHF